MTYIEIYICIYDPGSPCPPPPPPNVMCPIFTPPPPVDVECGCSYWFWVHKLCRITTIKGTLQRKHLGLTFHLIWDGGDDNVPCTCAHVGCYAGGLGWGGMITFLALAHMLDATQVVWGGGGMITFLALAHMLDATQVVWGGGGW